jgi:hypothetical protein
MRVLFFLVLFFLLGSFSLVNSGEFEVLSENHIPILNKVTMNIRANMESIITWQGKVLYKRKHPAGKWVEDIEITFYVDKVKNKRLAVSKHIKTEIDGKEVPLDIEGILLTDDLFYNFNERNLDGLIPVPADTSTNETRYIRIADVLEGKEKNFQQSYIAGSLIITDRSLFNYSTNNLKQNFNPFVVLINRDEEDVKINNSVCHYLMEVLRQKVDYSKCDIRLKYDDSIVEISYKFPQFKKPDKIIYDLKAAGNCTYQWRATFGDDAQIREVEYENKAGIWVPKKVSFKLRQARHETIEFLEQKINEPIPPEIFTPITLGARRGDHCTDARTKVSTIITDTSYPERKQILKLEREQRLGLANYIIISLAISIIGVALFLKFKQHIKSKGD